jgi:hypothetical protein
LTSRLSSKVDFSDEGATRVRTKPRPVESGREASDEPFGGLEAAGVPVATVRVKSGEPVANGVGRGGRTVVDAEPSKDGGEVARDGRVADEQRFGDLLIAQSLGDEA